MQTTQVCSGLYRMSIILRGDREVLPVWGDSDSVAITPLAHPTKQDGVLGNAHDAPSEPNKLHSAFSSARNRWQRHKPTQCVTNGRKGCSYLNLFPFLTQPGFSKYHSLTQLLSPSPVHPTHGTQHTPNVIPLTSLIPCHQDQLGKPQQ